MKPLFSALCLTSAVAVLSVNSTQAASLFSLFHHDPIYYGLKKDSYGSLSVYRDGKNIATPPSCNPNGRFTDVNELSRSITAFIVSPLKKAFPADDPIVQEELQSNFKITSDSGGTPPVAILDRSPKEIIFWHEGDLVPVYEVNNAAKQFCARNHAQALYEGSSRKCSEPHQLPVIVNGQRTSVDTYVISAFKCESKK